MSSSGLQCCKNSAATEIDVSTSVSKKKKKQRRPQHIGLAPGTLLVDPDAAALHIHLVRYGPNPNDLEEMDLTQPEELEKILAHPGARHFPMYWIDIVGHGSVDQLTHLGRILRLHPLALEDIVNSYQRPKVDLYDGDFFIVARMIDESIPFETRLDSEQLGMLVRPGLVATFCSLVFFGEIKGPRNLCFLGLAWIVTFAGVRAPCNKI